jgi:Zn-dependent peptidase ImmA (M78 family)/DNA-binding XRE family transcriptional regulator
MKNFAERVKSARIMKGYSLQDLSDALNNRITKQALSKYENGSMKPTSEVLIELCKALDVRVDYFNRDTTISLENVEFRKLQKLDVKEKESVKQKTIDILERYYELENLIGMENEFSNPLKGFEINSSADVCAAAEKLRVKWSLGKDPIKNVIDLLEDNNIKVVEVKSNLAFNGLSTFVNAKHPVVVLNSNLDEHLDRKRFTALHELGHLVLNLEKFDEKTKESFCHIFASAMLMPEECLRKELGDNRHQIILSELVFLKMEFGVSVQAILYRAKDLKIITENYFKTYMSFFASKGMKTNEPWKLPGKETSYRFKQLLYRAIGEEIISTSKAAALANMKVAELLDELAFKKDIKVA